MPPKPSRSSRRRTNGNRNTIAKTMGGKVKNQIITPETHAIKGFEKVAKVILERYDIAPYIKASDNSIPTSDKSLIGKYPATFFTSQVKLTRCDLEKVKENLKISSAFKFRCKICEKRYPDEKKLRNHHDNKHLIVCGPLVVKPQKRVSFSDNVIVHEVTEYHKCRKCTKIFANYRLLKKHMKENHKKRKCYICNYCTMSFVDRTIFKVHIKLHCDACYKLFPNKSQYVVHRRLECKVTKQSPRIIKINLDLLEKDKPGAAENLYRCDKCSESFNSKSSLQHHMSFLHLNNPSVFLFETIHIGSECTVYVCLFCKERFTDKDMAKKHVELLPDSRSKCCSYFNCNKCYKSFDTESELLSHTWSHILSKKAQKIPDNSVILNQSTEKGNDEEIAQEKDQLVVNGSLKNEKLISKCSSRSISVMELEKPLHELTPDDMAAITKPIVNPTSKKTLFSKFQCQECCKFLSSNSNLRRHMEAVHSFNRNLQCEHCEETFEWPSLLQSHKCLRQPLPEMPFDDARPEIPLFNHVSNVQTVQIASEIDGVEIDSPEDLNYVDFELPEPKIDIIEGSSIINGLGIGESRIQNCYNGFQNGFGFQNGDACNYGHVSESIEEPAVNNNVSPALNKLQNLGYKVILQDVPIEF